MCIVPAPQRLASVSVVFFGQHGDITQQAQQRHVSRQRLYREAHSVLRDLDASHLRQEIVHLRQQVADLQNQISQLQAQRPFHVLIDADKQAEFASTAQAEGVSLPVARHLCAVFLGQRTPSVAAQGRLTQQAGQRAGLLLEILDQQARPHVRQAAADEIFFGSKPVLMVVEPQSLCWLSGRLSTSRDGAAWASEFQQLPALEHLVRDGGKGLANGLARVNQQRQENHQEVITDQLDHFHTLREGGRVLRKTQARAERAWTAAEQADKKVAQQDRQGHALTGYATQAVLKWQQAAVAFHQWEREEDILKQIRQELRPFTITGELNNRERAMQAVEALAAALDGEQWDKFKRALRQPETYAYLDRLKSKSEALPVSVAVRQAVVQSEGIRQNPELVQGEGQRAGVLRGLLLVCSVLIAQAGEAGQQAVAAFRQGVRYAGKASSCVEGLNSVVRMQQCRHRKMSQGLLDLKRLYWNLRQFRTGGRKKTSPYERLGVPLPANLSWWQLLQLTPEQLRPLLSANPLAP
jgi:hypothetical protein